MKTTPEPQHTPTPWKTGTSNVDGRILLQSDECYIGHVNPLDAAYIVKCVNAHEGLLAFTKLVANGTLLAPEWNKLAKQAIAQAEEK